MSFARGGISVVLATVVAASALGCAPRIVGYKLKSNGDIEKKKGVIPYYLPKPYLLVTKNMTEAQAANEEDKAKKEADKEKGGDPKKESKNPDNLLARSRLTGGAFGATAPPSPYAVRIVYLPDLHNQYGLKVTLGTGSFDGSFTLKDGWMLTALNAKSDNQLDETITATAELAKAVGAMAAGAAPTTGQQTLWQGLGITKEVKDEDASLMLIDLTNGKCVLGWPNGCGSQPPLALGAGLCAEGCRPGCNPESPAMQCKEE